MLTELKKVLKASIHRSIEQAKLLRAHPLSLFGVLIILSFAVIGALAPVLAPPTQGDPYVCLYLGTSDYFVPAPTLPSPGHPFGTLGGYDVFYGCVWGIRIAFYTTIVTTGIALAIGLAIGSVAGYFGGAVDEVLMRFTDAFFAIPGLVYVLLVVAAMPLEWAISIGPLNLAWTMSSLDRIILALIIVGWPPYARLIRGEIKKTKQLDFVEAAKAVGCSNPRVLFRHVLPNSINPVIAFAILNMGGVMLAVSTVSFLGFGPPKGYAEWGAIIANSRSYLVFTTETLPFALLIFIPVAFLSTFVLGWTLLEDVLVDIIDPTLGRRAGL